MQPIITGLILSGGQGTRMGRLNKGLHPFGKTTLIEHVIDRLKNQVDRIVINANKDIERYRAIGYPVWPDNNLSRGPLSGFLTGLENCTSPYLMIVPCDTPMLPIGIVQQLMKQLQETHTDLCMPSSTPLAKGPQVEPWSLDTQGLRPEAFRVQPTFCLLKKSLAPSLREFLNAGGTKVQAWAGQQKCSYLYYETATRGTDAFLNLNTIQELKACEQDLFFAGNSSALE